ncbi:MAG: tRNA-dihydrouridine synthase [Candidatus Dojkabacteria bacterium]
MRNFWKELQKPFTALAPMEDVTDVVFRTIVAECGRPSVFFTEFTNADGMFSPGREKVIQRLKFNKNEKPIVAQIWGKRPESYFKAAYEVTEMGFDGVDINMGCPVAKIVKQGACSALIDNPSLAKEIIHATKEGTKNRIPVSVKTRIGFKSKKTEVWGEFLLQQGVQALTIHPRLAKDLSKYPADWNEVKKIVEIRDRLESDTVVIGNGDVTEKKQIKEFAEKFKVDGIMVGRGIFTDPFIFHPTKTFSDLNQEQKLNLMLKHVRLFERTWGKDKNFHILRRFLKIYCSGFDNAQALRVKLMQTESVADVEEIVKQQQANQMS